MIKHPIEFFVNCILIPYSVGIYIAFTAFMLRDFYRSWQRDRTEDKAKKSVPDGPGNLPVGNSASRRGHSSET